MKRHTLCVIVETQDKPAGDVALREAHYWLAKSQFWTADPQVSIVSTVDLWEPPKVGEYYSRLDGFGSGEILAMLGEFVVMGSADRLRRGYVRPWIQSLDELKQSFKRC